MYLFVHEVVVAALLYHLQVPVYLFHLLSDRNPISSSGYYSVSGYHCHLAILQVDNLSCVFQDGGHVRGRKIFPLSQTYEQGTTVPGQHEFIWFFHTEDRYTIGTLYLLECGTDGAGKVATVVFLYQVYQHLRVCITGEKVSFLQECGLQVLVVFNNAVMYQGNLAVAIKVGMGVLCWWGGHVWPSGCGQSPGWPAGRDLATSGPLTLPQGILSCLLTLFYGFPPPPARQHRQNHTPGILTSLAHQGGLAGPPYGLRIPLYRTYC